MKPFQQHVSSQYGAPMGRHSTALDLLVGAGKIHVERVPFVDYDYDQGGAYWGGSREAGPLYCAWNESGANYFRARDRAHALMLICYGMKDQNAPVRFFRGPHRL